jgi:hypothetical protein
MDGGENVLSHSAAIPGAVFKPKGSKGAQPTMARHWVIPIFVAETGPAFFLAKDLRALRGFCGLKIRVIRGSNYCGCEGFRRFLRQKMCTQNQIAERVASLRLLH